MPEIRATVPDEIAAKWGDLAEMLGTQKNADTLVNAINLLHLQFCSSRWYDLQVKAARLISASKNFITPLHPMEIKRISLDKTGAHVWTKHQGEPYIIPIDLWEKG